MKLLLSLVLASQAAAHLFPSVETGLLDNRVLIEQNSAEASTELFDRLEAQFESHNVQICTENPLDDAIINLGVPPAPAIIPKHPNATNLTVYQLIESSKFTTQLAKYIAEDKELIKALNSTNGVFTIFAPTDHVLKNIPEKKKLVQSLMRYHVSPHFYPLETLLFTHTVETLLNTTGLCEEGCPARLRVGLGPNGFSINSEPLFAPNVIGTNGVIHAIDAVLMPPFPVLELLDIYPTQFSTFNLALDRTYLRSNLTSAKQPPIGGTWFVPSNTAWLELGEGVVSFLFSPGGLKYLRAVLDYHIAPHWTLFSDGIYPLIGEDKLTTMNDSPGGRIQIELPTLLPNHSVTVDITGHGRFSEIRINTYDVVAIPDFFANDAVVHILDSVLFPPNKLKLPGQKSNSRVENVDDLKERLAPYVLEE